METFFSKLFNFGGGVIFSLILIVFFFFGCLFCTHLIENREDGLRHERLNFFSSFHINIFLLVLLGGSFCISNSLISFQKLSSILEVCILVFSSSSNQENVDYLTKLIELQCNRQSSSTPTSCQWIHEACEYVSNLSLFLISGIWAEDWLALRYKHFLWTDFNWFFFNFKILQRFFYCLFGVKYHATRTVTVLQHDSWF